MGREGWERRRMRRGCDISMVGWWGSYEKDGESVDEREVLEKDSSYRATDLRTLDPLLEGSSHKGPTAFVKFWR